MGGGLQHVVRCYGMCVCHAGPGRLGSTVTRDGRGRSPTLSEKQPGGEAWLLPTAEGSTIPPKQLEGHKGDVYASVCARRPCLPLTL